MADANINFHTLCMQYPIILKLKIDLLIILSLSGIFQDRDIIEGLDIFSQTIIQTEYEFCSENSGGVKENVRGVTYIYEHFKNHAIPWEYTEWRKKTKDSKN
ncbi:hypothetical protein HZS_4025 [Henneguya salminicola]|nr:hypothetical protein HZS_4025 [Henneguya salminicola]